MKTKTYKFEELTREAQERIIITIDNAMESFVRNKLNNIGIDTNVGYIDLTASEIVEGTLDDNAIYLTPRAINLLPLAVKVLLLNDTEHVSLYDLERFYISTNCKSISEQEKLPLYFAVNNLSKKIRSGFGDIIDEHNNRLNTYLYNNNGDIVEKID